MKILLAVDGSPYTQKMLAYLTSHQELLGAGHEYTLITVQPLLPARARAALGKDVVEQYYDEESTKILEPVRDFLSARNVPAQVISKVGPIADTIIKEAQDGKWIRSVRRCPGLRSKSPKMAKSSAAASLSCKDIGAIPPRPRPL